MIVYVPDVEAAERMGVARRLEARAGVTVRTGTHFAARAEVIAAEIGEADVVCVALGAVGAEAMDRSPSLKLIVKCGIGVDNIDLDAARERGIPVLRTAGVNFRSVAEFVIGSAIAALRRLGEMDKAVRSGRWELLRAEWSGQLPALTGKTIGVVGFGAIGAETTRLAQAHGMRAVAHDPYVDPAVPAAAGARLVDKSELLQESDVVSLHVLLTDETRHFIGSSELAAMRPTALLVNSSRGPVVDERALTEALRSRRIGGAVLDVLELEPPREENPLLELDNCSLTPHLAGCTDHGYQEIGALAAELVGRFAEQQPIPAACVVVGGAGVGERPAPIES